METVQRYVESFVNGLHDGGVRNAVICPGSRSTQLALTLSRKKGIEVRVLYDERSAAFFAVGMGKSASTPVVLVCTSGTAAANFFPAVVEAKLARVPMVVCTADRPPELRDFGAPQAIDQIRLYGVHVKWFHDMPIATDVPSFLPYSRTVGARASCSAQSPPAGPVHINFSFREPLFSVESKTAFEKDQSGRIVVARAVAGRADRDGVEAAVKEIVSESRGIIVAGPEDYRNLRRELSELARLMGWPILADPLSNLRQEAPFGLVRCYDILLRNEAFRKSNTPRWVIRIGGAPTSKDLNAFCKTAKTIILDEAGDWRNPDFSSSSIIYGDPAFSLPMIRQALAGYASPPVWLDRWLDLDGRVLKALDSFVEQVKEPFEGKVFHRLSSILNPSSPLTVVVGNSMPIRDLDTFFLKGNKNIRFLGNKGANGIDGLVSTAMGISAVEGNVLLVLGDLSFYHDMNGLLASKLHGLNATVLIINNDGGGIFSFLPQHALPKPLFERLFGTPHELDFSGVKTIYGGEFSRASNWKEFDESLGSLDSKGLKIIEFLVPDRERNLLLHRQAFQEICSKVRH